MLNVIDANWPAPAGVKAFTTTRSGGCSFGSYASLNLAQHVNDDIRNVTNNRNLITEHFKLPSQPTWLAQVHGTEVVAAQTYATPPVADACYSSIKGTVCAVLTADCLPILICDIAGTQIAAIHAGWRGLAAGIIEQTLATFLQPSHELLVWLGPAISQANFEVGEEVRAQFILNDPKAACAFKGSRPGHWLADLYLLARLRLEKKGVLGVYGGEHCTYSNSELFYSYRRDGNQTGRMASLIWLS